MQGNYSDRDKINKGWASMSSLLDQEMPVKEKDRRPVIWKWLIPVVLIICGLGYAGYQALTQNLDNDVEPVTEQPFFAETQKSESKTPAASNTEQQESTGEELVTINGQAFAQEQNISDTQEKKNLTQTKEYTNIKTKNTYQSQNEGVTAVARSNAQTINSTTVPRPVKSALFPNFTNAIDNKLVGDIGDSFTYRISQEMRMMQIMMSVKLKEKYDFIDGQIRLRDWVSPFLPLMPYEVSRDAPTPVYFAGIHPSVEEEIEPMTKPDRKLAFGIHGSAGFNDFAQISQFSFGPEVKLNLNSKLSLIGGLQYSWINTNGFADLVSFTSNNLDEANYPGTALSDGELFVEAVNNSTLSYGTLNNVASTFRQLQVPLAMQYHLSRQIFASAGLRYSYLTAAPDDLTFPAGSFQADLSSNKNLLIDNNLVRRSDFAASFGLGFYLGKHFLLRMDYFHGFSPYLDFNKSGSRSDYHRTFNLGLSYYIGP